MFHLDAILNSPTEETEMEQFKYKRIKFRPTRPTKIPRKTGLMCITVPASMLAEHKIWRLKDNSTAAKPFKKINFNYVIGDILGQVHKSETSLKPDTDDTASPTTRITNIV